MPVRYTPLMFLRKTEARQNGRNLVIRQKWTTLDKISDNVKATVIQNEDARFYEHRGFDFIEIKKGVTCIIACDQPFRVPIARLAAAQAAVEE